MINIEKCESSWCPIEKRFIWSTSARDPSGRLHVVEGRSKRAAVYDLENAVQLRNEVVCHG